MWCEEVLGAGIKFLNTPKWLTRKISSKTGEVTKWCVRSLSTGPWTACKFCRLHRGWWWKSRLWNLQNLHSVPPSTIGDSRLHSARFDHQHSSYGWALECFWDILVCAILPLQILWKYFAVMGTWSVVVPKAPATDSQEVSGTPLDYRFRRNYFAFFTPKGFKIGW